MIFFIQYLRAAMRRLRRVNYVLFAMLCGARISIGRGLRVDDGFRFYPEGAAFNIIAGNNLSVRRGFTLMISGAARLRIGHNVFFNNRCSISCCGHISIGNDCLFGENVKLYDHNHNFRDGQSLIREQGFRIGQIQIGDNVWIGSNVTILNNVVIGENVVIGAGCLIYRDIPANTLVRQRQDLALDDLQAGAGEHHQIAQFKIVPGSTP